MRLSALPFRAKLLGSYFALVVAVELVTILLLNQSLASDLVRHLDERLELQARGAAVWVEARREVHADRLDGTSADRQAVRLAGVVHAWVTMFDDQGRLIGDSERKGGSDLPHSMSEGLQPEVLAAKGGKIGHATRFSHRHGEDMHFVAIPGEEGVTVRLGVPLAEINSTIRAMRNRLAAASALGLLAAALLGLLAARFIAEPLRAMTTSATRLAQGDYDIAVDTSAPDEFGTLARSLTSLGAQLKARIGDLTHERDRLTAILEGMVEGVLVLGPDSSVLAANPSAEEILGVHEEAILGRSVADVVFDPGLLKALRGGRESGEARELVVSSEGERSLVVNVRPLAGAAGGGVVAVLHDITRMRRLEEMRKEFVANVSHELRTPVAAIQGYSETLIRGGVDARTSTEFLEIIHRHARRIGRLVEDLLRLAEIEARAPEKVIREAISVADTARAVAETVRDRLSARSVTLEIAAPSDALVSGDPQGLEQVIENLVDNAIKYGRERGTVRIDATREGDRMRVVVADDGPGIAPEHLPRIFERFYRVEAARSRQLGGTGLGLAIVRRLVEGMRGTIVAESEVGVGTRFIIELLTPEAETGRERRTSRAR